MKAKRYRRYPVILSLSVCCLLAALLAGCQHQEPAPAEEVEMTLTVSSSAFHEGAEIPARYTCEGQDISPPLNWSEPPAGTKSIALIVDDPDAPGGVFTHWVLFNLPSQTTELAEAMPAQAELPSGAQQGKTDFGRAGYGGPCPPPGRPHRYQFTVYALDQTLDLKAGASKGELLSAMSGHILAQGRLTGIYQR